MALAFALVPSLAAAQPFVEVGIGAPIGGCIATVYDERVATVVSKAVGERVGECSRSPLGGIVAGYEFNASVRVQVEHWSSLGHKDRGVEMLTLRYRYVFD